MEPHEFTLTKCTKVSRNSDILCPSRWSIWMVSYSSRNLNLAHSVLALTLSSAIKQLILCNSAHISRLCITNTRTKNTLSMKLEIFLIISSLRSSRGKKRQYPRIKLQDFWKATGVITAAGTCNVCEILEKKIMNFDSFVIPLECRKVLLNL